MVQASGHGSRNVIMDAPEQHHNAKGKGKRGKDDDDWARPDPNSTFMGYAMEHARIVPVQESRRFRLSEQWHYVDPCRPPNEFGLENVLVPQTQTSAHTSL